ncbi:MAG: TonB-dependent receptor [Rhodothermales bacterium]|nr:TonB-dependent receptor [Rhodothermales bacterium]
MTRLLQTSGRGLAAALVLVIFFGTAPAWAQTPRDPSTQVLTAGEIAQAGIARFSDLFRLLDRWYAVSLDGYTYDASAFGLGALQENSWALLVDGQPVDLGALGQQTLNALPLALSAVDSVEVVSRPVLIHGVLAQGGLIHVHTHSPAEGATVRASISAGNEVGDPGPFRYTPFASPNIDRTGPVYEGAATVAGPGRHLRIHARADEHHASDERIRERVFVLYAGEKEPRLFVGAVAADGAVQGRLGRHTAYAGFSRFQDLAFVLPLGREVPRDQRLTHAGLRGEFFPGAATGLRYRVSYTGSDLAPRTSRTGIDFAWRQHRLRGSYEVHTAGAALGVVLGVSGDLYRSRSAYTLTDTGLFVPRAYGQVRMRPSPRTGADLTVHLTRTEGVLGYGALADVRLAPAPQHTLRLAGTVARAPYEAWNRPWLWVRRGYGFFGEEGARVNLPSSFDAESRLTLDASWTLRPSPRAALTVFGAFRRFTSQTLAAVTPRFDPATTAFDVRTALRPFVAGRVTAGGAALRLRLLPSLDQRLHYTYLRYPADDVVFFEAWSNQPWHRFSYTARFVPVDRLSLYARLGYTSASDWPAFDVTAQETSLYEADLPAYWLLDLAVQKRFWAERGRLHFGLRNLLNEPHRTHPAGAVTDLLFDVRVQLRFHTGG